MRSAGITLAVIAGLAVWTIVVIEATGAIMTEATLDHGAELYQSDWQRPEQVRYRCADNGAGVVVEVRMPDREVEK